MTNVPFGFFIGFINDIIFKMTSIKYMISILLALGVLSAGISTDQFITPSDLQHISSSTTKSDYGFTNVTAQIGANAYLPCKVKKVFNKSVSWVRVRDDHILTVDRVTFIADERFNAFHTRPTTIAGQQPTGWTLQIKYVQARDAGLYECQVSTEPKISARVNLHVVVPRTELIGESIRYVKTGSRVTIHCIVTGAIDPPLYIIWTHDNLQILPDNNRGLKTDIRRADSRDTDDNRTTIGTLLIPNVRKSDSGNYSCAPSNSEVVSMTLHVINAEYSASAITSSGPLTTLNSGSILMLFSIILLTLNT